MKASKTEIEGETRIKVEFPYDKETVEKIKSISGARWCPSAKAWHLPYKKESFAKLKEFFPDIEYPKKPGGSEKGSFRLPDGGTGKNHEEFWAADVCVEVTGRRIILKLPKNKLDIHFITSLRYSRWDRRQFCWIIPNYPGNLDLIVDYFKDRIRDLIIHEDFEVKTTAEDRRRIKTNEILILRTLTGRLKLIFSFNEELTGLIKSLPYHHWDVGKKWWTVPYSEKLLNEIRNRADAQNMIITYEEERQTEVKAGRITPFDIVNYRICPEEFIQKLKELRYSGNTIKTYRAMFEEFINYYPGFDIKDMDEKMIIEFLRYLVNERKVSISYQNQSINAIKFYYERILGGQRKVYLIERPRKEKKLPVVLNEEEVIRVINGITNIKHKAIVMLIYSSGLRLSELLNLRITDIDSKRMQIFVRQAKGRKDRYTLLSKKVLLVLRNYVKECRPKEWLFEGAGGGQYSATSVYMITKEAYRKAGIKKKASVHTLRHCFGTHLLENGTDLRYIQALMGHESSKTTEIYTHVTTRGFNQIINPIDKLSLE
jgi:site-specific recombinase XerD